MTHLPTGRIEKGNHVPDDTTDHTPDTTADFGRAVIEQSASQASPLPVSVWATAQNSAASQRQGRYIPESTAHPAKMLPAIAAHAITHYTRPGDLVLDPMCGIGTTLVEAIHLGRRTIGVEYEPHWATVTQANLDLARQAGITTAAQVLHGDARQLPTRLPPNLLGQVALVVTSPPYGPSTHGQVTATPGGGVHKHDHLYGNTLDRGNLANIGHHRLLSGFTKILTGTAAYLRPPAPFGPVAGPRRAPSRAACPSSTLLTLHAAPFGLLVHAIEAAYKSRFPAARRANDSRRAERFDLTPGAAEYAFPGPRCTHPDRYLSPPRSTGADCSKCW